MKDIVSIVIPVYNTEKWLKKCVSSVLNQTYRNLEIILVDDGSPDNSPEICDQLAEENQNVTVYHKENGGLSSARNYGIEKASGKYILFLDSDDWLDEHSVEDMVEIISKEHSDAVYPNRYYKVFDKGGTIEESLHFPLESFTGDPKQFAVDVLIGKSRARRSTAVLYALDVIKRQKGECLYPLGRISEDFFFNLRFLKVAEKISIYTKPSLYNLKRAGSISASYYENFFETVLEIDEEVIAFLDSLDTNKYQIKGKREGLFFRNAYIFALNILGDKKTSKKERKQKCKGIFEHERFQNAIHSKLEFPFFEGKLKRCFFKMALWLLRRKMYRMAYCLSFMALKFNAV